jgi:hypothetical protein
MLDVAAAQYALHTAFVVLPLTLEPVPASQRVQVMVPFDLYVCMYVCIRMYVCVLRRSARS